MSVVLREIVNREIEHADHHDQCRCASLFDHRRWRRSASCSRLCLMRSVPHDLAHFVVEGSLGLDWGFWVAWRTEPSSAVGVFDDE
jgi:hypothetical protein